MDFSEPFKLIGIHNENPVTLFVQFSLGDRYFMYECNKFRRTEHIKEQIFDTFYTELGLDSKEEEFLIGKLQFYPKTKRVISEYRYQA